MRFEMWSGAKGDEKVEESKDEDSKEEPIC